MIKNQYKKGFNSTMSRYRALIIADFFRKKIIKSIADIGSGPGEMIQALDRVSNLIKKAHRITGFDADKKYLKSFNQKYSKDKRFSYINIDIEKDQFSREKYDLVFMVDLLEHLYKPLQILKKIKKILSPDGYLVVISPNAKSLHRRVGKEMRLIKNYYQLGDHDFKVGHKRYFDHKKMESLLKGGGFNVVYRSGILLKPLPNAQMDKMSESYCDALLKLGVDLPEYCGELFFVCKNK